MSGSGCLPPLRDGGYLRMALVPTLAECERAGELPA
jgi:hypothetical protein